MENIIMKIQEVITQTRKLLRENSSKWSGNYSSYIDKIKKNKNFVLDARKNFHVPKQFGCYVTIGKVYKKDEVGFSLRVCGQEVATIHVKGEESPQLVIDNKLFTNNKSYFVHDKNNNHPFQEELKEKFEKGVDWKTSPEAKKFRKFFAELDLSAIKVKSPEHHIEFLLLKEFQKSSRKGKEIIYIQPLKIANSVFAFRTAVNASGKDVEIGKQIGGGIDILARTKKGRQSFLTVIEVKDENKKSEPPLKVLKQAASYATFIRELLRSPDGEDWWKFMGMTGTIPSKLVIRIACAMPKNDKLSDIISDPERRLIPIPETNDELEIHTIYFEYNQSKGKLENFEHNFYA